MDSINNRLRTVIARALGRNIDPSSIVGEHLIEELGITSVDALEILIHVENEFEIHIDDGDLSQALVSSLANLEAYIEPRLSQADVA